MKRCSARPEEELAVGSPLPVVLLNVRSSCGSGFTHASLMTFDHLDLPAELERLCRAVASVRGYFDLIVEVRDIRASLTAIDTIRTRFPDVPLRAVGLPTDIDEYAADQPAVATKKARRSL